MTTFTLREWQDSDRRSLQAYANNKTIADRLRDGFPHPYTPKDAEDYLAFCQNSNPKKAILRAIAVDGIAVGSIGLFIQDDIARKSAELGYWLGESFWGQGIMTEAVRQICAQAFKKLDLVRIYATPFSYNHGSRRVLEKAGFTLEGILRKSVYKNGVILDSCMYAKIGNLPL